MRHLSLLALPALLPRLLLAAAPLSLTFVGELRMPTGSPEGLSGIDRLRDNHYAFLEDSGGRVHFADIFLDLSTGMPTNLVFTAHTTLPHVVDGEGIAIAPNGTFYVSDEHHSRLFSFPDCPPAPPTPPNDLTPFLPALFQTTRPNRSLESLSLDPDDPAILWTATEDSLPCDGPGSSPDHGTRVRLCRLSLGTRSDPQAWFFPVEPAPPVAPHGTLGPSPFNGISDLCAIGKGRLIVMERAYGPRFVTHEDGTQESGFITMRLSFVDTHETPPFSANDPSPSAHPLTKIPLDSFLTADLNYEGICLGPTLPDGSRTLVLVSDGDKNHFRAPRLNRDVTFQWGKAIRVYRLQENP